MNHRCPGDSPLCPADALRPEGSLCDDEDMCTSPDTCQVWFFLFQHTMLFIICFQQGDGKCSGRGECECMKDTDCDDGNPCSADKCVNFKCFVRKTFKKLAFH